MDLPERILKNRISSRLGMSRLTFEPYTRGQLQEIVSDRLSGLNAFDPQAVELCARKVAALSGDARRALDICRLAASLAGSEGAQQQVTIGHITRALEQMNASPIIHSLASAPLLERLFMIAVSLLPWGCLLCVCACVCEERYR